MMATRGAALLLSVAALRVSAQGPNTRNGDPVTEVHPWTPEVEAGLFKSGASKVEWVLALDFGPCKNACGELTCAEDMFAKVNSVHAFKAILESMENTPGCGSYKVDTDYHVAPFIWEDDLSTTQCWLSGDNTKTTCGQDPDPQFMDIRVCPCMKEAGKKVAAVATDAVESSPADENEALILGSEKARESLYALRSSWIPAPRVSAPVLAFAVLAVVGSASMLGLSVLRAGAGRPAGDSRLLAISQDADDQELQGQAHNIEC